MLTFAALLTGCAAAPASDDTDVVVEHVYFAFPVPQRERIGDLIGVDHKPGPSELDGLLGRADCLDYLGRTFPHCYDGHDGSDFQLVGGVPTMDAGSATITAAADGTVDETHDGEFDHCKADVSVDGGISCDGQPPVSANYVIVLHDDGTRSKYWHMKKGSVLVAPGDTVKRGDALGLIGSSGISSFPHLHFEVELSDGSGLDPYAGPESQDESWWCDQQAPDVLPGPCE
jgi:hypothetical protein